MGHPNLNGAYRRSSMRHAWWAGFVAAVMAVSPVAAQNEKLDEALSAQAEKLAEREHAAAKNAREARVPVVVQEEEREKVDVAGEPTLQMEDFQRKLELQVAQKRQELLAYLEQILATDPPENERPELLFQKAELFQEEAQSFFFKAMEKDDEVAAALDEATADEVARLGEEKDALMASSAQWREKAVALYREIGDSYPEFPRMPEVLNALAQAYWETGEYRQALPVYKRLIKEHPKSKYVPDAWLAYGEYFFQLADDDERDVKRALDAYERAAADESASIFGYAVYKQGWCHYNLSRYDRAAEKFKEVILYSELNADLLGERRIALSRESRKDFVLAYAQYGGARGAPEEFGAIAKGDELGRMLERLADIYYGDGKDRDAILMYRVLMKRKPDAIANALYQGKIVKLASRIGEKRQVVRQARALVKEFERVRARVERLSGTEKERANDTLERAERLSDNTLRYLATSWHNEAKKTRVDATFEYAYEMYGDFLELFPESSAAYEMRFFYAELLYRLEKFELAGEQYVRVFQEKPDGKWAEAAAEEAVRAYDELIQDAQRAARKSQGGKKEKKETDFSAKKPFTPLQKKYLAACQMYVKAYPEGRLATEVRFKVARVLYGHNYFKDAIPEFVALVDAAPSHPRAIQAANLALDSYNVQEDWEGLSTLARKFRDTRALMRNAEFAKIVDGVITASTFKLLKQIEDRGEFAKAAEKYLEFAQEFPSSDLADEALANAAAMWTRAGELEEAIKVRKRFLDKFPKSPLAAEQMFALSESYAQVVSFKSAATWLERFASKYPKDARVAEALLNASVFREGIGDTKKAVADREAYLQAFPTATDRVQVAESIPQAWERAGQSGKAAVAYSRFADKYSSKAPGRAAVARFKAAQIFQKKRRTRKAAQLELKALEGLARQLKRRGKLDAEVADAVAYLDFLSAEGQRAAFKRMKIHPPDNIKRFQSSLVKKREAKEAVKGAYTEVVKVGSARWAVAALFRIGELDAIFIDALLAVPPPRGLTETQEELFRDKLGEQTYPLEESAVQTMTLCMQKSAQFGVWSTWTKKCYAYLQEKAESQFPSVSMEVTGELPKPRVVPPAEGVVLKLPKSNVDPIETDPATAPQATQGGPS